MHDYVPDTVPQAHLELVSTAILLPGADHFGWAPVLSLSGPKSNLKVRHIAPHWQVLARGGSSQYGRSRSHPRTATQVYRHTRLPSRNITRSSCYVAYAYVCTTYTFSGLRLASGIPPKSVTEELAPKFDTDPVQRTPAARRHLHKASPCLYASFRNSVKQKQA